MGTVLVVPVDCMPGGRVVGWGISCILEAARGGTRYSPGFAGYVLPLYLRGRVRGVSPDFLRSVVYSCSALLPVRIAPGWVTLWRQ